MIDISEVHLPQSYREKIHANYKRDVPPQLFNTYSAEIDLRRQNLTSEDVSLKLIPGL